MNLNPLFRASTFTPLAFAASTQSCPSDDPDSRCDPDRSGGFPGGPDDVSDPDGYGRGAGDVYSGPDGSFSGNEYS